MRTLIVIAGILLGSLLFSMGLVSHHPELTLLGFILLPASAIYGLQSPRETGRPSSP